ncbi:hypothetical protein EDD11_000758 [Mortierella claussenii]|nr:hypothetical protein EDD11_000758 [Mortierella claussenii]
MQSYDEKHLNSAINVLSARHRILQGLCECGMKLNQASNCFSCCNSNRAQIEKFLSDLLDVSHDLSTTLQQMSEIMKTHTCHCMSKPLNEKPVRIIYIYKQYFFLVDKILAVLKILRVYTTGIKVEDGLGKRTEAMADKIVKTCAQWDVNDFKFWSHLAEEVEQLCVDFEAYNSKALRT